MRIALVQEDLTGAGKGLEVFRALLELFHGAEVFTLQYSPGALGADLDRRKVHVSTLQRLPFHRAWERSYRPLYWGFMRGFDLVGFDLIVSNNLFCAKWVPNPSKVLHVSYCQDLLGGLWEGGGGLFGNYLRRCDLESNGGVTHFLAPDEAMRSRIKSLYGRDSDLLPFPVDAKFQFKAQVYFRKLFGAPVQEENLKI